MWILSRHSGKSVLSHDQLESLVLQRTAALQALSQRLLKVQDEERRRVARDLHDSTGQTLTALRISVALLQEKVEQTKALPACCPILQHWPTKRSRRSVLRHTCCIRRCWTS